MNKFIKETALTQGNESFSIMSSYILKRYMTNKEEEKELTMKDILIKFFNRLADLCNNEEDAKELITLWIQGKASLSSPMMFNRKDKHGKINYAACTLIAGGNTKHSIFDVLLKSVAEYNAAGSGTAIHLHDITSKFEPYNTESYDTIGMMGIAQIVGAISKHITQGHRESNTAIYSSMEHSGTLPMISKYGDKRSVDIQHNLKFGIFITDTFLDILEAALKSEENKEDGEHWYYTFSPHRFPKLTKYYGKKHTKHYLEFVNNPKNKKYLTKWDPIKYMYEYCEIIAASGGPYMSSKGNYNRNITFTKDVINGSNLCNEIGIPTSAVSKEDEHKKDVVGETGICVLSAVPLEKYVIKDKINTRFLNKQITGIDFKGIIKTAKLLCRTMNSAIDKSSYATVEGKNSTDKNRPIAIGVMGYADVLIHHKLVYGTTDALILAHVMYGSIYYGAMRQSIDLSINKLKEIPIYKLYRCIKKYFIDICTEEEKASEPLKTFLSSNCSIEMKLLLDEYVGMEPIKDAHKYKIALLRKFKEIDFRHFTAFPNILNTHLAEGIIQPDLCVKSGKLINNWDKYVKKPLNISPIFTENWELRIETWTGGDIKKQDWISIREDLKIFGCYNSLVTAPMPTYSTSIVIGQTASLEPITFIYGTLNNKDGESVFESKHLKLSEKDKKSVIKNGGSLKDTNYTDLEKRMYMPYRKISQEYVVLTFTIIEPFCTQSSSTNLSLEGITTGDIIKLIMLGYHLGSKTLSYYFRNTPTSAGALTIIETGCSSGGCTL